MQSIKEIFDKIKAKEKIITENTTIFTMLIIILIAFSSFGLGRLSIIEESKVPISVRNNQNSNLATISETTIGDSSKSVGIVSPQILPNGGKYVASKNSDKYHAPWCSGAQRIKEENKIWFNSKEEAETSGYVPASNCKGI